MHTDFRLWCSRFDEQWNTFLAQPKEEMCVCYTSIKDIFIMTVSSFWIIFEHNILIIFGKLTFKM